MPKGEKFRCSDKSGKAARVKQVTKEKAKLEAKCRDLEQDRLFYLHERNRLRKVLEEIEQRRCTKGIAELIRKALTEVPTYFPRKYGDKRDLGAMKAENSLEAG